MSGEVVFVLRILLAGALYAFIGWAFYTLWKDLRQQSSLVSKQRIPALSVSWALDGAEKTEQFSSPSVMIGRDPACECPLPNETVSARHARLVFHHKQWWLEDLNSKNGTFINEEPLYTATVIESGDEVRCGQVALSIMIEQKS